MITHYAHTLRENIIVFSILSRWPSHTFVHTNTNVCIGITRITTMCNFDYQTLIYIICEGEKCRKNSYLPISVFRCRVSFAWWLGSPKMRSLSGRGFKTQIHPGLTMCLLRSSKRWTKWARPSRSWKRKTCPGRVNMSKSARACSPWPRR